MDALYQLRQHLNDGVLHRALRYAGPGRLTLSGRPEAVAPAAYALAEHDRPDLALALVRGRPGEAGAGPVAAVRRLWGDLFPTADAVQAVLPTLDRHPVTLPDLARSLREARALAELGVPVDTADWAVQLDMLVAASTDLRELIAAALAGSEAARNRLPERCGTPGEPGWPDDEPLDPLLVLDLCSALTGLDDALAVAFAEQLSAVVGAAALDAGDPGTAAAMLLLGSRLLGAPPVEATPPLRGGALDERYHLAGARRLPPEEEVAPGVTAGALLAEHARPEHDGVTHLPGVVFAERDGLPLQLHLFLPPRPAGDEEPAPLVVFLHGGGWETGSPAKFLRQAADWAAAGWVTAVPAYRLVPQVEWPAPLLDVRAALRYLTGRAAELGVDPTRVALVGNSAGGHLALLAAADGTEVSVRGVVCLSPLTDTQWPHLPPEGRRLLERLCPSAELLRDANPVEHVHGGLPPVLTVGGSLDELTTADMLRDFHGRLDAAGVPNELHVLPDRWHAFEFAPADNRWWSELAFRWLSGLLERRAALA